MFGPVVIILFGGSFFAVGFFRWYFCRRFFKQAIIVQGIITRYIKYTRTDSQDRPTTRYHTFATFEFDGETREIQGDSSVEPKVGEICKIGINPKNIKEARIYFKNDTFEDWVFVIVGLLIMALGVSVIVTGNK